MHDCNDERERMRTSIPSLPILNRHQGATRRARALLTSLGGRGFARPSLPYRSELHFSRKRNSSVLRPLSLSSSHPRIRTYEYMRSRYALGIIQSSDEPRNEEIEER